MNCSSRSLAIASSQSSRRASCSFAFFPDEKFLSKNFHELDLYKMDPQPGDLFLFALENRKANLIGSHAAVYCGHGELIHFMVLNKTAMLVNSEGLVYKEGLRQMRHTRKLLRVLRKRGGIDIKLLETRVYEAMNSDPPRYNLKDNNCMHFALKLLDMDSNSMDMELTTMD